MLGHQSTTTSAGFRSFNVARSESELPVLPVNSRVGCEARILRNPSANTGCWVNRKTVLRGKAFSTTADFRGVVELGGLRSQLCFRLRPTYSSESLGGALQTPQSISESTVDTEKFKRIITLGSTST